jgi:hypothetical protein
MVVDIPDEVHALSLGAGVDEKMMNEPGANEINEALLKSKLKTNIQMTERGIAS